jgi:hypothetical protein
MIYPQDRPGEAQVLYHSFDFALQPALIKTIDRCEISAAGHARRRPQHEKIFVYFLKTFPAKKIIPYVTIPAYLKEIHRHVDIEDLIVL